MSETYLQVSLLGARKTIEKMKNVLKQLGFTNEKTIVDHPIENGKFAVIVSYSATDEQVEMASNIFKHIQIRKLEK